MTADDAARPRRPRRPARRALARWRAGYRQLRQHRAFRIGEPRWDETRHQRLRDLADSLVDLAKKAADPDTGTDAPPAGPALSEPSLAEAATNLWRARKKLTTAGDDTSRVQRQVSRYLRTGQEALDRAGVTIQDHDGDRYDARLALELIASEEDPSVTVATVTETIRPSVYLAGRCIQMGQVIAASPPEPADENPVEDDRAGHH